MIGFDDWKSAAIAVNAVLVLVLMFVNWIRRPNTEELERTKSKLEDQSKECSSTKTSLTQRVSALEAQHSAYNEKFKDGDQRMVRIEEAQTNTNIELHALNSGVNEIKGSTKEMSTNINTIMQHLISKES